MRVFLVAVPLGGVFIGTLVVDNLRDALRVFVLAQAAVICGLYLQVLVNVAGRVMERSSDRLTNEIRRGHMCTLLAIFVLLSEEIWRVVGRLGEDHFNWRTPLLQLALWLLLLGWLWMERRRWRTDASLLEPKPTPREEARRRARQRVERQSG
jgi:hypothetical protein